MPPHAVPEVPYAQAVVLFTDGSAWTGDRIGGWAYLFFWEDNDDRIIAKHGWAHDTTNNRMEMQAWIEGLIHVHDLFGPAYVLVYSDSNYVGGGAMNRHWRRDKNKDLWPELDQAIDRHVLVEYNHVKGHTDSVYNNQVDRLAGEARKKGQNEAHAVLPTS